MRKNGKTDRQHRFQVLADGEPIVEKATRKAAEAFAKKWRQEGKRNVQVWDTRSNPLTGLF